MTNEQDDTRSQALKRVAHGELSAAEVLDAALSSEAGRKAIEHRLAEKRDVPTRRVRVSERQTSPPGSIEPLLAAARSHFEGHPDVVSVAWGVARVSGVRQERAGLVVHVKSKGEVPDSRRIPSEVALTVDSSEYRVNVDVQEPDRLTKDAGSRVGDFAAVVGQGGEGTLSLCLQRSADEYWAFFSGHVAKIGSGKVRLKSRSGETFERELVWQRDNEEMDAAVVGGLTEAAAIALTDPSGPIEAMDAPLIDTAVFIKGASSNRTRKAFINTIFTRVDLGKDAMNGLIELDREASQNGDSGAPAVDSRGHLIGFVVGRGGNGRTYLISAQKVIDAFHSFIQQ